MSAVALSVAARCSVPSSTALLSKKCLYRRPSWLRKSSCGVCPGFSSSSSSSSTSAAASMATSASTGTAKLEVELVPCLKDNYAYLLHDKEANVTAIVDPSEAGPVLAALERRGLTLTHVLNTHHHWDHTGGNLDLKKKGGVQIVGPKADEGRIPGIDIALADGEVWQFGNHAMHVFDTPGHTKGHVSFYFPDQEAVFTGDTLFALGCGRLFEGTAEQMWASLSRLAALPPSTRVFCGHEYTQARANGCWCVSNAKFSLAVEPNNAELVARAKEIDSLRKQNKPTIPSTIGIELATSPFLRPSSEEIRRNVNVSASADDVAVFAAVRRKKDNF
eukprot:jgi/Chlat1/3573/Chrsp234S03560